MGNRNNHLLIILVLAASVLLTACAGTARGVKQSVYQADESLTVEDRSRSQADAMVVIRYPAVVEDEALDAYYRTFEQNAIGGNFDRSDLPPMETDRVAQSIIAKSNFYVMSLYRELSKGLPRDAVLLSPHAITVDENKRLSSRPLLASETVPSVITIDFSVYSFPDPRKMMDSPPLTFGDIVTPLFVIHANRWARAPTNGLLLSSEALVEASWTLSREQAEAQVEALLEHSSAPPRTLDFVRFLDRGDMAFRDLPLKSPGESRREVLAVEVHPLEKIRMNAETMARLNEGHAFDPFAEDFVKGAATRIITALNSADHDRATFFERQAALSQFDPDLGIAFLSRSGSEDLRARLQMGEALLRAERTFLSAQSTALYEGAFEGTYGDQMRSMIAAEFNLLEDRRNLARQQNWSTALAVVALAGAAYAGTDANSSNFFQSSTFNNLAVLTSIWAANTAMQKYAQSKTVGDNFLLQMAPAINRQVSVQLEWLESTEEITARDFAGFREKTMTLYQNSVRGITSEFDPRCLFGHPAMDAAGTWFGPCSNGRASSEGYGVIVDAGGNTIEYLGQTADGMADGNGAMIFSSPMQTGSVYYEGNFSAGQPDGVVLVEEAGSKPRVRTFRAGVDKGSANADQLQRVAF
jgi:predicted small secreted protein